MFNFIFQLSQKCIQLNCINIYEILNNQSELRRKLSSGLPVSFLLQTNCSTPHHLCNNKIVVVNGLVIKNNISTYKAYKAQLHREWTNRFGWKMNEIMKFSILDERTKFTILDEIWMNNGQLIAQVPNFWGLRCSSPLYILRWSSSSHLPHNNSHAKLLF